jgi:hypothetical protein
MILYEHRVTKVRRGAPKLVTEAALEACRGFRSVYGWPEDAVKYVLDTGRTAGLKYFDVFSNVLLLDFDNNPEAASSAQRYLLDNKYTHTMWDSGGRSIHFHIKIEPMQGRMVPPSQKAFVSNNFPGADLSFYNASGMYRLPNTAHEKNPGRYKQMIGHCYGKTMLVPTREMTPLFASAKIVEEEDKSGLDSLLTYMMFVCVSEGDGRNNHAFKIAKICRDLGYEIENAMDIVETWSSGCANPSLEHGEVETTVRSAYRK